MNERIRQLAGQALDKVVPYTWTRLDYNEIQRLQEYFARLIVRECAEQIIAKGTDWVDFAPSQTGVRPEYWDMAQQIKQHFGVEE